MKINIYLFIACALLSCENPEESDSLDSVKPALEWRKLDQSIFEDAAKTDKFVLLDIGANWCHWCHVMDEKTYADQEVQEFLIENFILVREDQDSRPDLYAKYRPWGWPAIIVFNSKKEELLRLKGYQEKSKFIQKLEGVINDPQPITDEQFSPSELNTSTSELINKFISRIDYEKGMYHQNHKYLEPYGIAIGIQYYHQFDSLKKWTDLSIENSYALVDPVWSGAYQYSTKKSWNNQHYEKLLRVQANYITSYARYAMVAENESAKQMAKNIYQYCENYLKKGAAFYNSQNADVVPGSDSKSYYQSTEKERLEIGVPSVDKHIYTKENMMLGKSMMYLWAATGDNSYLQDAVKLENYFYDNVMQVSGVYNREAGVDALILSLDDNLKALDFLMMLYQAKGSTNNDLVLTGKNLIEKFDTEQGMKASITEDSPLEAAIVQKTNLQAVLTLNLLGHLTKEPTFIDYAKTLFDKLDKQQLLISTSNLPLLIRAQIELNEEPYHAVYISDGQDQEKALSFYKQILNANNSYILFESVQAEDFTEEQEMLYGGTKPGVLFMCTSSFCSAPIKDNLGLQEFLESN